MNAELKQAKQQIRPYLQQISDTALWQLCAMAKDEKVVWLEPYQCIRGIVGGGTFEGYQQECSLLALTAEQGVEELGYVDPFENWKTPERFQTKVNEKKD
jgi:hypothetical protein